MNVAVRGALTLLVVGSLLAGSTGCSKRKERRAEETAAMSDEAVYRLALDEIAKHNLRRARDLLERVQFSATNLESLEPLVKLGLADVTFYQGDDLSLIEARSKYLDFVTLHADHPRAPYAQFQAGVCNLEQVRDPSRDQGQTHQAIEDFREVVRRYPTSRYARAARGMIRQAESNLAEHEFQVGKYYLKRKKYGAAAERLGRLLDRYPHYGEKEKLYFYLGRALILSHRPVEGRPYLDRLLTEYPESAYVAEAKKILETVPSAAGDKNEG